MLLLLSLSLSPSPSLPPSFLLLPLQFPTQIPLDLSIPSILENISSPNPQNQLAGVQSCRKLLSKERNPPLDAIIA